MRTDKFLLLLAKKSKSPKMQPLNPSATAFLPKRKQPKQRASQNSRALQNSRVFRSSQAGKQTVEVDLRPVQCKNEAEYEEPMRIFTDLKALNISEPAGSPWQWITVDIRYRAEPKYLCGWMYEKFVWNTSDNMSGKDYEEILVKYI